jgi:predicted nuclease with TOPRIM domain
MTRTTVGLSAIALVTAFSWGCGRVPDPLAAANKTLESKVAKLQSDLTEMNARFVELDQRLAKEQARTRAVEAERDAIALRLKSRTDERDAVQSQFDGLVKTLESALGHVKAARGIPASEQLPTPRETVNAIKVLVPGSNGS